MIIISPIGTPLWGATSRSLYVTDELTVPLRSGPSTRHRILTFLKSSTALTQANTQNNTDDHTPNESSSESNNDAWVFVTVTSTKRNGWIKRDHITTTPTAAQRLESQTKAYNALQLQAKTKSERLHTLETELATTHETLEHTRKALAETQKQLKTLQDLSADAIALDERNRSLAKELTLLEVSEQQLQLENRDLQRSTRKEGILQGMLAVIAGVILATVLPRLQQRRRHSDW
ncbi:MAG: TIGR04211 family SH3 domain-containing protein [Gammaproteobacteria bacterium]